MGEINTTELLTSIRLYELYCKGCQFMSVFYMFYVCTFSFMYILVVYDALFLCEQYFCRFLVVFRMGKRWVFTITRCKNKTLEISSCNKFDCKMGCGAKSEEEKKTGNTLDWLENRSTLKASTYSAMLIKLYKFWIFCYLFD